MKIKALCFTSDFADGDHMRIDYSVNCEVRDSYFHHGFNHVPTGCPTGATRDLAVRAGTLYGSTSDGSYHFDASKASPQCWEVGQ